MTDTLTHSLDRATAAHLLGMAQREVLDVAHRDDGSVLVTTFDGVEYVVVDAGPDAPADAPAKIYYAKPPRDGYAGNFPVYVTPAGPTAVVTTRLVDEFGVELPTLATEPGPGGMSAHIDRDLPVAGATPAPVAVVEPTEQAKEAAEAIADKDADADGQPASEGDPSTADPATEGGDEVHVTEPDVPTAPRAARKAR